MKAFVQKWWKTALFLLFLSSPWWGPLLIWRLQPAQPLRVKVVDYTVPFDNYTEHVGLMWLLNHLKLPSPSGAAAWEPSRDYIGYRPTDRAHPESLAQADLSQTDWLYVADTYGVYVDDLEGIEDYQAHMDFNQPVFGGFSAQDASALEAYVSGGGHLMMEFNAFCAPTGDAVRRRVERLAAVAWTGWVGRYFLNLHDEGDVPHWLPRLFRQQYPGRELPTGPTLVLMDRRAKLVLVTAEDPVALMPLIKLTEEGRARFGDLGEAAYFNWFSITQARPGGRVLATLQLPAFVEARVTLQARKIPLSSPFLVEHRVGASRRVYVGGDFSEVDFDPGWYSMWGISWLQAWLHKDTREVSARAAFWGFFMPVLETLLREDIAQKASH